MMHLVDDPVGGCEPYGFVVVEPSLRVGVVHIDDGTTLSVHTHGTGKDSGRFVGMFLCPCDVKGIELAFQVAFDGGAPDIVQLRVARHLDGLAGFAAYAFVIEAEGDLTGLAGCKELEGGGFLPIDGFGPLCPDVGSDGHHGDEDE